jgi:hypothetical protein
MEQIAYWLERLALRQYAQTFAENGIDVSLLHYLTDQDLEKIGVLLGHRRKILAAIAELKGAPELGTAAAAPVAPHDTAERRQVTVMFSDLVGSTALSARMDPEDLREIISAYQRCVAETVQRFGGFVAKYMGDGVLMYFGYPHCKLNREALTNDITGSEDFTKRFAVLKTQYDSASRCAGTVKQAFRDVVLTDMAQPPGILKSMTDSIDSDINRVSEVQNQIGELSAKMEISKKAMKTLDKIHRTMCIKEKSAPTG